MRHVLGYGLLAAAAALALGFACCSGGHGSSGSSGGSGGSAWTSLGGRAGTAAGGQAGAPFDGGATGTSGGGRSDAGSAPDANGSDAGAGAWWDDSRTTWTPLPWQPSGCQIRVARNPVRVAPKLVWKPCPGGAAGCTLFEPAWPPDPENQQPGGPSVNAMVARTASGYRLSVSLYYHVQENGGSQIKVSDVLYDESGAARAVMRGPWKGCSLQLGTVAGDQTCLELTDLQTTAAKSWYACGTRTDPVTMTTATFSVPETQWTSFSGEILAMDPLGGAFMRVYDLSSHALHNVIAPGTFHEVYEEYASGPYALMRSKRDFYHAVGMLWERPDKTITLVDPGPGESIIDFKTDGKTLVWMTGVVPFDAHGMYATAYMYTAPFTDDPTSVTPTRVRTFPNGMPLLVYKGIAADGYYVFSRTNGKLDLFRLSDGHHWTLNAPKGLGAIWPMEVDANNVAYWAGLPGIGWPLGLVMQRIDGLGAGD